MCHPRNIFCADVNQSSQNDDEVDDLTTLLITDPEETEEDSGPAWPRSHGFEVPIMSNLLDTDEIAEDSDSFEYIDGSDYESDDYSLNGDSYMQPNILPIEEQIETSPRYSTRYQNPDNGLIDTNAVSVLDHEEAQLMAEDLASSICCFTFNDVLTNPTFPLRFMLLESSDIPHSAIHDLSSLIFWELADVDLSTSNIPSLVLSLSTLYPENEFYCNVRDQMIRFCDVWDVGYVIFDLSFPMFGNMKYNLSLLADVLFYKVREWVAFHGAPWELSYPQTDSVFANHRLDVHDIFCCCDVPRLT